MAWLLDKLFGADDLQADGDAADEKLRAMNARDYGEGGHIYNLIQDQSGTAAADKAHGIVLDNLTKSQTGNVSEQLGVAFDEGWEEGKGNVSGFIGKTFGVVGDVLTSVLKGIPWWVWGIALLYFGWPIIAPMIARKAASR
jgi:hypothetical protein